MAEWKPGVAKLPKSACLQCGYRMDAASSADNSGALPRPGDPTVCIKCGAVMLFADDLSLRGLSDDEIQQFTADRELMAAIGRVVQAIHFMHASAN